MWHDLLLPQRCFSLNCGGCAFPNSLSDSPSSFRFRMRDGRVLLRVRRDGISRDIDDGIMT